MKHKLRVTFFLLALLLPALVMISPVQAGDPDDTIGPADPTHLVCVEKNSHLLVDTDYDAFGGYNGYDAFYQYDPDATVDVERLKDACKEAQEYYRDYGYDYTFVVEYIRQTRIEGSVFEFFPDPNGPGGWSAARVKGIPVVASGPGFELIWVSESDGQYWFDYLGAGPIDLNLRLPPNAHPINQNITVMSDGLYYTWQVDLAFYRGDVEPPPAEELVLPLDHIRKRLVLPDTRIELDEETGNYSYLPNVGGVLPLNQPVSVIVLAVVVLIVLPAAGILTLRRK